MKSSTLIVFLILQQFAAISQDLIILKNEKDTIKCKILEDKITYLRYRNSSSTDTAVYQINQSEFNFYVIQPQEESRQNREKNGPVSFTNKTDVNDTFEVKKPIFYKAQYKMNIGLGFGLDYGGIGGRLTWIPIDRIAAFACIGYITIGTGWNAGVFFRILPEEKVCPYIGGMYGYNAFIKINGADKYNKIYNGTSFCFGLEFRSKKLKNFCNVEILLPIRSQQFNKDIETIRNTPSIKLFNDPLPIAFSLGYHIAF